MEYLRHLWFDPLSASEKLDASIFLGLPLLAAMVFGAVLFQHFWDWYNHG